MKKHIKFCDSFIEGEIWISIPGYEGVYEISDLGRIKSLPKIKGRFLQNNSHILNEKDHRDGYTCVALSKDNKMKHFQVHRLVAMAFIPNTNNLREVNHKDLNKKNNALSNLEWISSKENKLYSLRNGRLGCQKINWDTAREIRRLRKDGKTIPELIKMFPIKRTAIGKIIYNKSWIENENQITKIA